MLRYIPLGGVGDVTMNMHVYEYQGEILIVDCGIGFPDSKMLGVDILIPDVSYLERQKDKIKGIVITHGHEDHFGALPYVLPKLGKVPVFGTKLVLGFIESSLRDHGGVKNASLRLIDPRQDFFKVGSFKLFPFHINHSVPDALGFVLEAPPKIRLAHVADFKFDWTPVDGRPFEISRLARLAEEKIFALFSDCLGSQNKGYTQTERDIEETFDRLLDDAHGQVFITAVSSSISRIQQAINSSRRHGRKVVLLGRSVVDRALTAERLGYLEIPADLIVKPQKAQKIPDRQLTYIVAGCYGQPGSGLWRIANGIHKQVSVKEGALVIFSGDPSPPGVKDNVDEVVSKLTTLGAEVHYYEIQESLHVSGHGSQGDLLMLASIVKPRYFVPIGGDPAHMRSYKKLMGRLGVEPRRVFELSLGQSLEIEGTTARRGKKIPVRSVMVDGYGIGDVGRVVLHDRRVLAESGMLVVILQVDSQAGKLLGEIEIVTRGFVFVKESRELIGELRKIVEGVTTEYAQRLSDTAFMREIIEERLGSYIYEKLGRTPMILPVLVEV